MTSAHFPVEIQGERFKDVTALAANIAWRAEVLAIPDRNVFPVDWFLRWMREDATGRITGAVREAAAALVRDPATSGDAFQMAIQLVGHDADEALYLDLLDRVERGLIRDSKWYGGGEYIAAHEVLPVLREAFRRRPIPGGHHKMAAVWERFGRFSEAFDHLSGGIELLPGIPELVERWVRAGIEPIDVETLGRRCAKHPPTFSAVVGSMVRANAEARAEFVVALRRKVPDRAEEVAAVFAAAERAGGPPRNHCQRDGLLGGAADAPPEDAGDYYGSGRLDLVPCSHLVCGQCGQLVRNVASRAMGAATTLDALYAAPNWTRTPLLDDSPNPVRLYACRCTFRHVVEPALLAVLEEDGAGLPWSCAGHAVAGERFVLDGVVVDGATDLGALVQRALAGDVPPGEAWARVPAIWVLRLYGRLRGTPRADEVSRAVGEALLSPEDGPRSEALTFFLQNPRVPGAERLLDALRVNARFYEGRMPPDASPGETYEFQALRILGSRWELGTRDLEVPALLRSASLRPGLAAATLPYLVGIDPRFVLERRYDIASAGGGNAMEVAIWIRRADPAAEEETHRGLVARGLLDEGDF